MSTPGLLLYADQVQLLRAAAELLRLPQPVIATALTFLHRYHRACPPEDHSRQIAPACLFLASKVEEATFRVNDLINSFLFLETPSEPEEVHRVFPVLAKRRGAAPSAANGSVANGGAAHLGTPPPQGSDGAEPVVRSGDQGHQQASLQSNQPAKLLVGDAYYAAKDQLIQQEQLLLRWLGFELSVDHPYRYLLNCANAAGCTSPTVASALCLVNDSLMYTNMSAHRPPTDVAAGTLLLAKSQQDDEQADTLRLCIEGLGVTWSAARDVAEQLLKALEAAAQTLPALDSQA